MTEYRVTDTQQVTALTQAGTPRVSYRVWIVTARGSRGYVDIPAEEWRPEAVEAALNELAERLDLAFEIGG